MKLRKRSVKPARIEMMPLIDIVFLLLVFFIYAMLSMAVHRGLELDLPESATAVDTEQKKSVHISIRRVGERIEVSVDKQTIPPEELGSFLLSSIGRSDSKPPVLLFAEESISYQQLYMVLDVLKKAAFTEVSLQASSGQ